MTINHRLEDKQRTADTLVLLAIAGTVALVHILTNGRYGFHRDELQFLTDARHMEWGFVAYPPFTPFVERISMGLFGLSLVGLRLFSVLAQAAAIVVTGLMARELGGGRLAQVTAALAVVFAALPMFEGTEFQYSSFDYLWWVLIAYFVVRLLQSGDARWCVAIGAVIGVGLLTKYSITFFIAGLIGGMVFTRARRFFLSGWFWGGVLLAVLICLPNFVWQMRHDYVSLHFLQHIHKRDMSEGRTKNFLLDQLWICTNPISVPLWVLGLMSYFRSSKLRMLGWMYVIPLAMFFFSKGRGYYMAGAYPLLFAMGAVSAAGMIVKMPAWGRRSVEVSYFTLLTAAGLVYCAILLPTASSGKLRDFALKNNGDLREEIGWNEQVDTVAQIWNSLPPAVRAHAAISTSNYGETGAIEILGAAHGLPAPFSRTNSAWYRGYPRPTPTTIIVLGLPREDADFLFTNCRLAGHNGNSEGVKNEESEDHPDIFLCGPPRDPWPEFWSKYQSFG
jgi:hypothetical protein